MLTQIELNIHRINELSEYFVYFNDDMYIIRRMNEKDFLLMNYHDSAILDAIAPSELFSLFYLIISK